jgi:AcrR family transcriptional regulator
MNHRSVNRSKRSKRRLSKVKVSNSKILKVALELFSSEGYSDTKMLEIAKRSGISVGALYLRFKSKEELCLELIKDQIKDFIEHTKNLTYEDPAKTLEEYIVLNLECAFKRQKLLSIFIREFRLPFLQPLKKEFFKTQQKIIEDILIAGIKKGVFRPMDTKEVSSMIFASLRGVILLKIIFGIGNAEKMSKSLFKLIIHGIRKG